MGNGIRARWAGFFLLAVMAGFVHAAKPAATLPAGEWKAIRAVIASQLQAFQDDDGARAFSHATPEVRKQFGTAEVFLEMVKSSYYPLYRPRSTQFLEPAVIEGQVVQPLQVVAEDGAVLVALYTMIKGRDKVWKISSCQIAPSKLEST